MNERFDEDFMSAYEFFTNHDLESPDDDESEIEFQRALDYFEFDFQLADDRRVIERFAVEHGPRLSADERALIEDWKHSRFAAFEVTAVEPGHGMHLRDVVTGEDLTVLEPLETGDLSRWEIVVSRVLRVRDHYEMGGFAGIILPASYRAWLRLYLEEERSHFMVAHPEASYEDFTHANSQNLYQFLRTEVEPALAAPPTVVTPEGDLGIFCRAAFDVLDHSAALSELRAAEEFAQDNAAGDEISFSWREAGQSLDLLRPHGPEFDHHAALGAERGGIRILGSLAVSRRELTLEVTSRRRLEAGKELLQRRLGCAIQHRRDEFKPLEAMLAQTPAAEEPPEAKIPAELQALRTELIAQQRRKWIDQAIPALQGETPREAVKTLAGRVRVIRLLKQFQAGEND
ncbi:MAG: MbcA/ParS/Xre antitoxin family protein, partial [Chloroflexi bacterium]|nr:MbcA/ParS/Xre antitoxin family protein [Chloroflexota bacterium]